MKLELDQIITNGGTQSRTGLDGVVVYEYADAMKEGAKFPPVVVFHDGQDYYLADGFHRVAAATQIGALTIEADVRQGTLRDAVLYSAGANGTHGLRRTHADKRRAVERLLRDDEWSRWSDREIARHCNVSAPLVGNIRKDLAPTVNIYSGRVCKTADGRTMDTRNIGASSPSPATELVTEFPTDSTQSASQTPDPPRQLVPGDHVMTRAGLTGEIVEINGGLATVDTGYSRNQHKLETLVRYGPRDETDETEAPDAGDGQETRAFLDVAARLDRIGRYASGETGAYPGIADDIQMLEDWLRDIWLTLPPLYQVEARDAEVTT